MHLVEHRLTARVPVAVDALLEDSPGSATFVRLRNLSLYGAYAETAAFLPRHRRVWMYLRAPSSRSRAVVGATVVRCDEHGIGLEFDDYGDETATVLSGILSQATRPASSLRSLRHSH